MTNGQITIAAQDAPHYADADAFISDMILSSTFLPPDDETAEPDMSLAPTLRAVWIAVNGSFAELLDALGMTQTECSRHFRIQLRTVQKWKLKERECPLYIRLMMVELCYKTSTGEGYMDDERRKAGINLPERSGENEEG